MKFKKGLKIGFFGFLLGVLAVYFSDRIIRKNSVGKLYNTTAELPKNKVGLLLGTVKYLTDGRVNLYYQFRVDAAVKLLKENKIDVVIISGDNGSKRYDEPTAFKEDLLKAGISENRIFLDYAGFRTLDSVVRAKEVFGQSEFTIISQEFHNERAVYLAEYFGIKAIGFNAQGVSGSFALKVQLREYLARVKVFIDILLRVQPAFLGKKIEVK